MQETVVSATSRVLDNFTASDLEYYVAIDYVLRAYFRVEIFAYGLSWVEVRDRQNGRCSCPTCVERWKRYERIFGVKS